MKLDEIDIDEDSDTDPDENIEIEMTQQLTHSNIVKVEPAEAEGSVE